MSDLFEDPYVEAEKAGLDVVLPAADELFIDIDDEPSLIVLREMQKVLDHNQVWNYTTKSTTSQGGGTHVYIKLPERTLTPLERICLQACLGSDRKRELLSLMRIWFMADRPPTTFFEVRETKPPEPFMPDIATEADCPF